LPRELSAVVPVIAGTRSWEGASAREGVGSRTRTHLNTLVFAALFAIILVGCTSLNLADGDLWHEMALAREILERRSMPLEDSFAYTPVIWPVVHHEWGAGVLGYFAMAAAGGSGILVLKYVAMAWCLGLCFRCAHRRNPSWAAWAPFALPVVFLFAGAYLPVRAQAYSLAFAAALALLLLRYEEGDRRWIPAWLALFAAWVNLHAGCAVGIAWLGTYTAERLVRGWRARERNTAEVAPPEDVQPGTPQSRGGGGAAGGYSRGGEDGAEARAGFRSAQKSPRSLQPMLQAALARVREHAPLLWALAGMGVLLSATPYGLHYYGYLRRALTMPRPRIMEWLPVWQAEPFSLGSFLLALALLLYGLAVRRWQAPLGISVVLGSAVWGAMHVKMLPFFAVAWFCWVPALLSETPLARRSARVVAHWNELAMAACVVLILAFGQVAVGNRIWEFRIPAAQEYGGDAGAPIPRFVITYPTGPVDFLRRHAIQANAIVPFSRGGYVSWHLAPQVKVAIDGRYEVAYQLGLFEEVTDFYNAQPGWEATLSRYPTDLVLVALQDPVAARMPESGWQQIYHNDGWQIWAAPHFRMPPDPAGPK
jgi:hypothetical protein